MLLFLGITKMAQGSAINDILQMRQQGLSNNQIIQNLQRQGYNNTQIFDAMNQADTKMAVEGIQHGTVQPQESQVLTRPPEIQPQDISSMPAATEEQSDYPNSQVKIEELVETIIEEKWAELIKDVNKIIDWKTKIESKITELEAGHDSLKQSYSDLHKAIIGKVNDYDKHILEIGSDIKAMEQVFSKVLPAFTENVNKLSKIANKFKEGGKNEKISGSS